ncbi:MAG: ABC transporter permease [Spirochaetes bacterium]|nr:ABC transporter permease [Spirochaetota bacterium]
MGNSMTQLTIKKQFNLAEFLKHNAVVILFIFITIIGAYLSGLPLNFLLMELISRMSRNPFLILSLIIPIVAGVGLNFGIVVGAMAGQIGLILATYFGIDGTTGILFATAIATPLAIFFGWLTGSLYNRTKGQEMIAGLFVGFFAEGIYQFVFLILIGTLIPFKDTPMLKPDGIGLRNTISMGSKHGEGMKYAIDYIFRMNVWVLIIIIALVFIIIKIILSLKNKEKIKLVSFIVPGISLFVSIMILTLPDFRMTAMLKAPVVTFLLIAGLCLFNVLIMKTKLGQDFKAIGQSQHIASVAGINVDQTRMVAVIISIVFAAWGQIIFLQNIGTMNTYASFKQVGFFAIASILIGGATVTKATIWQCLLGCVLFHSVFIVSPNAGKALFGDAQLGEFFRAFVVYGVIGISLALHAWKSVKKKTLGTTEAET